MILRVGSSSGASGVLGDEDAFYKLVELIEQDIREDGADYCALRYTAERLVVRPIFHVSCIEEVSHEFDEPRIMNMLT